MISHNIIPTINKPTTVTRNTATAIDHSITKSQVLDTMNILFLRDIKTKNQQTYLNKNCMKQQGITLRI